MSKLPSGGAHPPTPALSKSAESISVASSKFKVNALRGSTVEVSTHAQMDLYHRVVSMGWLGYLGVFASSFLIVNAIFGALYYLGESSIGGLASNSYWEYFFFSVQTLATIGYGSKFPQTLYADVLVTLEAMLGLLGLGLFAAIAFARLSIPKARIIFSKVAVIAPFEGVPTLMFRVANERNNRIIGADVELSLLMRETTQEGLSLRKIHDLNLLRNHTPMLSLTWLICHPIDENSPLLGLTADELQQSDFALIATLKGLDETISQTVHANHIYANADLRWDHRFEDMFAEDAATGKSHIDLTRIHDVRPAAKS
jgi:inward rectifier potassium channel